MLLAELNTPFERKKIITYASDNTTAICKNKKLQHIVGTIYKDENKSDKYGQISCRLYCYFEKCQIGIDIGGIPNPDTSTVEEIQSSMEQQRLSKVENLITELDARVSKGFFIPNGYIKLAEYIAPDRVFAYTQARFEYLAKKEKQKAKTEEENRLYCENLNAQTEKEIEEAVTIILNGGYLENTSIVIYKDRYNYSEYKIINYLAKKFGISIPIKVQGWINKSLVSINVENGSITKYSYQGNKSKTIFKYLDLLTEAIKGHAAA